MYDYNNIPYLCDVYTQLCNFCGKLYVNMKLPSDLSTNKLINTLMRKTAHIIIINLHV